MRRLALAALLLAGCASVPAPSPSPATWQGRLAVRVEATATQPSSAFATAFELHGDDRAGELALTTPIGTRAALARWNASGAELHDSQGVRRYPSLDALAHDLLQQDVPLAALPAWLAGQPWAGAAAQVHDGGFAQLGWVVDTRRRAEGELEARRDTPPAVLLRVRLEP